MSGTGGEGPLNPLMEIQYVNGSRFFLKEAKLERIILLILKKFLTIFVISRNNFKFDHIDANFVRHSSKCFLNITLTVFPRIILRSTINFNHKIFKNFVTTIRGCSII